MRIETLQYILEVARAGSISAAAKNLWIGQTTLSAAIQTAEKELDIWKELTYLKRRNIYGIS